MNTRVRWVLLGLCCVAAFAFVLTKGIYFGSRIELVQTKEGSQTSKPVYEWVRICSYLYPSGVVERNIGVEPHVPGRSIL